MKITIQTALPDDQLLSELNRFAASEKQCTAHLVAHLAELDVRKLHLGLGFSSLFKYGCEVLHLSEHETYNRIEAARLARKFPVVLDLLSDGEVNLTTLRLLAPLLTADNHRELLALSARKSKREVEELVARTAPRPDVPSSVRKVPVRRAAPAPAPVVADVARPAATPLLVVPAVVAPLTAPPPKRPVVAPLSPDRYQMTFTVDADTRDTLRRLQDLLRHSIPSGDAAQIVQRALAMLLKEVERKQCSATSRPRKARPVAPHSRHIPAEVNRAAHERDEGKCAFVGKNGRRCGETGFIQRHHLTPYAASGEAKVENIRLYCSRHNQYESDLYYGARRDAQQAASSFQTELSAPQAKTLNARHPRFDATGQ